MIHCQIRQLALTPLAYCKQALTGTSGAGEIREAFHTEIHHLDVKGKQHFANMSDPQIPESLAPVVLGVVSMSDFKPRSYLQPRSQYQVICEETSCKGSGFNLLVPADVQTIYNLTPAYRQGIYGQGQTIVVIEDAMPWSTDPTTYQNTFNLGVYGGSWTNTQPDAGGNCSTPASPNADEGEADIDVEIALGVTTGAAIQAASCQRRNSSQHFRRLARSGKPGKCRHTSRCHQHELRRVRGWQHAGWQRCVLHSISIGRGSRGSGLRLLGRFTFHPLQRRLRLWILRHRRHRLGFHSIQRIRGRHRF